MNRKQFIKRVGLAGIGVTILPQLTFSMDMEILPYDELIGKGSPKLLGHGFNLRQPAHDAFLKMKEKASESGISLKVVSSYRNFNHQNKIWERKYKRFMSMGYSEVESIAKIVEYSTIPGTSRHHWGTDLDIVDGNANQPSNVLHPDHFDGHGCFAKFKNWMDLHANEFGFYLVYTNEAHRKGFKYEPWHYSYKPLSRPYLGDYRQLNIYDILKEERLMGSDHFSEAFLNTYIITNILDINPELL